MCEKKGRAPAWENHEPVSKSTGLSKHRKWMNNCGTCMSGWKCSWAVIGSIGAPLISWFWLQHLSDPRWVHSTGVFTLHWRMSQISRWIPAEKQQTQIWRMQPPGRALNPYFMSLIPRYLELEGKGLLEQIQMLLLLFTTSEMKEGRRKLMVLLWREN